MQDPITQDPRQSEPLEYGSAFEDKLRGGGIKHQRPKNFNLLSIKFPLSAVMSVGHRAAGIFLFLALPYFLYFFQISLTNEDGFMRAQLEIQTPLVKIFGLISIWALAHHFFAGIRYFLLDLDIGIEKDRAHKSALMGIISGFLIFSIFAILLF